MRKLRLTIVLFLITSGASLYFNTGIPMAFAEDAYSFITKWGSLGNYDGLINLPASLAVDSSDNIYVTDTNNNRIEKFSNDGKFLAKWGTYGTSSGEFNLPTGIAIDSGGNIYIADQSNNRIQEFDSTGKYIKEFSLPNLFPARIAVDSTGNLYFTDQPKNILVKFANNGQELARVGSLGTDEGKFDSPSGIVVDKNADVYVVDTGNDRIQKFTSDGQFLTKWGSSGTGNDQMLSPTGVAVDSSGNVYISDSDSVHPSIQKFAIGNLTISSAQKNAVPEFGSTTFFALTVAIFSLLIFTANKFRFS